MASGDPSKSANLLSRITPVNVVFALIVGLGLGLIALLARRAASLDSAAMALTTNPTSSPTATLSRTRATPSATWTAIATFTPYPTITLDPQNHLPTRAGFVAPLTSTPTLLPASPSPSATAPEAQPCVAIASDSNGIGEVTAQIPTDESEGVIEVQPLSSILQAELKQRNIAQLEVHDYSMTAASLTSSGRTDYYATPLYQRLLADRCRYDVLGPYLADLLNDQTTPQQYAAQLVRLVSGLVAASPNSTLFVMSHYDVKLGDWVDLTTYGGFNHEHIAAFQLAEQADCQSHDLLGGFPQVVCVDTQAFFADMGDSYLFTGADMEQYRAFLTQPSKFTPQVNAFFDADPQGSLVGDGFHLSLAGRHKLMGWIADYIAAHGA